MSDFDDMKNRLSALEARFDQVSSRAEKLVNRREFLEDDIEDIEVKLDELEDEALTLKKVEELYKHLLDEYVHQYAESFTRIVTEGLQTIFYDQDISFEVKVGKKRGKVNVEFETVQNDHRGQALEAFGGGVAAVQSLLLRVLVVLKTGLTRTLILDESLAALSEEYIPTMAQFLKKLCDQMDVDILLITHNKDFADHCDRAYLAESDDDESPLRLEEITDES